MLGYGVDLTVAELARRLVLDYGHSVDVWTPTSDGTYAGDAFSLRELIVYGRAWNRFLPLLELNAQRALRGLAERLESEGTRYDVIVPCTHPYYGAGPILGAPDIFFNFGNVPTTGFGWKSQLNWAWLGFSEDTIFKPRATRVVSISHFLHNQQSQEVQRKGSVLHLAGDHYYSPKSSERRSAFRGEFGIPAGATVIAYCGRMHKQHAAYKGNEELLRLGQRIASVQKDFALVTCGLGSEEDAEWIRSYGAIPILNLPPERMPDFYNAIDIYLTASRWEGFNLPLVEAAWHGVPSIAYDAGAHGEHVTSVLVPDGRFDELCSAALTLVRDRRLRERFAQDARRRAQHFSWKRCAAEFEAILRSLQR
jgi:glycosyltransferase involved in cell wall biosynthesis